MSWEDRAAGALNRVMLVVVAIAFVAVTAFMIWEQAVLFSSLSPSARLHHWGSLLPPLLMVLAIAAFAYRFLRRRGA